MKALLQPIPKNVSVNLLSSSSMLMFARLGLTVMTAGMKGSTRVREAWKTSVPSKIISSAMETLTDTLCVL